MYTPTFYSRQLSNLLGTSRPGVSFIEVLIFMAIVGIMAGTILPLLFNATESRQRQDAIALVEQDGAQVMETIVQEIRKAERILDPPIGGTGYILALQTGSGAADPTIIARDSGAILLIHGQRRRTLSSDLVGVTRFAVDNTSVADDRQSVAVSLGMRRTIRLHQPLTYDSNFTAVINLDPDDTPTSDVCGCPLPHCDAVSGLYIWQVCEDGLCVPYTGFPCVPEW